MRSLSKKFRRFCSTSAGIGKGNETFSGKDGFFLISGVGSIAGLAYHLDAKIDSKIGNLDGKIDSKIGNLDGKIASNSDKSDAKFDSLRSEIQGFRSDILSAFSNKQGERIRALEVEVAAQEKK